LGLSQRFGSGPAAERSLGPIRARVLAQQGFDAADLEADFPLLFRFTRPEDIHFILAGVAGGVSRHAGESTLQEHLVVGKGHENRIATLQGEIHVAHAIRPQRIQIDFVDDLPTPDHTDVPEAAAGGGAAREA